MLSELAINRIQNYPYQSNDQSILIKYIKYVCNIIINYIPLSVSPNIITVCGVGIVLLSTIIQYMYASIYSVIFCIISLFIYQILDNLDGMQGKRTNMYNNPTTELFDHGCDSITSVLTVFNIINIFNIESIILSNLLFLFVTTVFYSPTWEHRHTQIMQFRGGISNPTECLLITQFGFLLTIIFPIVKHYIIIGIIISILMYNAILSIKTAITNVITVCKGVNIEIIKTIIPQILSILLVFYNICAKKNITILIVPWLISVIELIWSEITYLKYNISKVMIIYFCHAYMIYVDVLILIPFTVMYYFYTFNKHTNTMCRYLNMKKWYSLPQFMIKEDTGNNHTNNHNYTSNI